jgi:hypothetical protein
LKKKIQKFPKFYFRCIIGKESTEFQKVFFWKKIGRRWPNGQKFVCVKFVKSFNKMIKKVPTYIRWQMCNKSMTQFNGMC